MLLAAGSAGTGSAAGAGTRSPRNQRRIATYSTPMTASHGRTINPAKPRNVSPDAENASRLVRFETGSRIDAELDRCPHA